jgi:hypothetical protein
VVDDGDSDATLEGVFVGVPEQVEDDLLPELNVDVNSAGRGVRITPAEELDSGLESRDRKGCQRRVQGKGRNRGRRKEQGEEGLTFSMAGLNISASSAVT